VQRRFVSVRHLIVLASACAPAPQPIAVGMTVVVDRPDALEVIVETAAGPRALHVRARAGATEQTLDGFVLRTERDAIAIAGKRVASRNGAWTATPLAPADADALARILSLDITLAVQGSSLVFDGEDYAACTVRCTHAEACRDLARCADDIVVFGACLVREP
jgi:hypothetical protein